MSDLDVTVTIPVGPYDSNKRWLEEALESVRRQTRPPKEILIVDDMAHLALTHGITTWHAPWRLGVAAAFNCGVSLASTNLVFMLGSDDWLEPECIEECVKSYERERTAGRDPDAVYYAVGVRYNDERPDQYEPCNAAMVTKALWRGCGGFPPETASGAPDAALVSTFMVHPDAGRWVMVDKRRPLYNYRSHEETDTAGRAPWQGAILETRNILSRDWRPPTWTNRLTET